MTRVDQTEPGSVATPDPADSPLRVAQARQRRFILILAVLGAFAALVVVFVLAQGGGRLSSIRLLLIGVSLGYSLSGLTSLFLYAAPNAAAKNEILFWILGSRAAAKLDRLLVPLLVLLVTMALLQLEARRLNALAVGDEASIALGVEPNRLRRRR